MLKGKRERESTKGVKQVGETQRGRDKERKDGGKDSIIQGKEEDKLAQGSCSSYTSL